MTDVAIAGGGIAGSALAIMLGRQGLSVALFERGKFPKEKACGEGLMPGGTAVLSRLGLAEFVGGAPFRGVRYHLGGIVAQGRFPAVNGLPTMGAGQRRKHLDRVLFDAAAATPGVTAHAGARVTAPLVDHGRVVGLAVEGQPQRASLVVAADGPHSLVRQALHLDIPSRRNRFGMRAHFRLAPGKSQPDWVNVFSGPGHELYVTPLPHGEFVVAALAGSAALPESREKTFRRWCLAQPGLASQLEGAEQISELLGASPLSRRARAGVAPGVALLGDAAGVTDPITGGGMTQALMAAELLACHVASHMPRGSADAAAGDQVWLRAFDRRRRAMLRNYQLVTEMMLWLAENRHVARGTMFALRFSPALFSRLIGICGGVSETSLGRGPAANASLTAPSR